MKFTLFNHVRNSTGVNADKPWPDFVKAHLMDHQVITDKSNGQLYSGAVYEMDPPRRGDANVESMSMMVVDYDNSQGIGLDAKCAGLPTLPEDVEPELAGLTYAFHSTHSHTVDWPRWRLVIPFNREITRGEWRVVFAYIYDRILGADENIDISCKDLSRAYWGPACTEATQTVAFSAYEDGELLDVDEILDDMGASLSPDFVAGMSENVISLPTATTTPEIPPAPNAPAGRNDYLKQIVAAMLERNEPLEEIVCQVYQADVDKHGASALFSDASEGMRGSAPINALSFVTNVIRSIDSMRTRAAIEPQLPQFRPVNAVPETGIIMPGQAIVQPEPLEIISAASLKDYEINPVEWLLDGWMPRGQTTAFYGDGGIGKTMFIQQLMTAVSGGMDFMGKKTLHGPVMGLFAEDDTNQLALRQRKINTLVGTDFRAQEDLLFMPRPAQDNVLMEFDKNSSHGKLTPLWHALRQKVQQVRPIMLVIDTAADTFGGIEVDRQQVRRYIQEALTSLAIEFNLAMVLLAHPSAAGLANGKGTGGSTAWNNTPRCRAYMYEDKERGGVTVELMKNNYGPIGEKIHLKHNGLGFRPDTPEEMNSFVTGLKAQSNEKWVTEKLQECWDKKINISFAPRANYAPKQIAKLAKIDKYDIHINEIERIVFDLDKRGKLELQERGHNKSHGGTIRYIGH